MEKKSRAELFTGHNRRLSEERIQLHRPEGIGAWGFGASLTQPIFTGGRLRSGVRLAEAREQTALLVYQQLIQGAFRSVSDALVAYRKTREFRKQEELLFESAQDAARLSHMRYTGGVTGYLEVLTNETNAFSAELPSCRPARMNCLRSCSYMKRWEEAGSSEGRSVHCRMNLLLPKGNGSIVDAPSWPTIVPLID